MQKNFQEYVSNDERRTHKLVRPLICVHLIHLLITKINVFTKINDILSLTS